jgi:hypothetical protein
MAKKSAVNRNLMVRKLVKQYAPKRKALKETAENEALSLEERFDARLKLAALPRNGASARLLSQDEDEPDRPSRIGFGRSDPRSREVELVGRDDNGQ